MTNQTLRNALMGLALIALAGILVLLGSTLLPSSDAAFASQSPAQAQAAPSLTAVAEGCKQGHRVRPPRLQHDPLKMLLRGIFI